MGNKRKYSEQYLEWNQAIYVDEEGLVYVPDKELENGSIYRIDLDGQATLIASDLISKLDRPKDKHNDVIPWYYKRM